MSSRWGSDEDNPSSQEYISNERREWLASDECKKLFSNLHKSEESPKDKDKEKE